MNLITLVLISMSYLITANEGDYLVWFIGVPNTAKVMIYCPERSLFLQYVPASTEGTEQLSPWIHS